MRSADFFATHPVFTQAEFSAAGGPHARNARTVNTLLSRQVASGRLARVRRGLYATVPPGQDASTFRPDPYLVATKLADDAVVAFHAALQFRGKTYSLWHRYAVLSDANLRPVRFRGDEFAGIKPPKSLRGRPDHGGGVVTEAHAGGTVRVTTFERTLVDLLDRPDLGGGWEEVWRSLEAVEYFDLDAVVGHVLERSSPLLAARVGFFLDQHRETWFVEDRHLEPLRARSPGQPGYLDPGRARGGRLVKAWNLVVPAQVLERAWAEVP
jgi:predicted transcriptional regulator of viral defense system